MMWVEKHRPEKIEDMIGNEDVRISLIKWLEKWEKGSKAALLVGPPGIGKTTLVRVLAKKFAYNIVELNSSDTRTKETLSLKIGEAINSQSLLSEKTIIFLDEVDGLSGRADYGAVDFIKDAIRESNNPIILAANDPDSEQVRKIKESCIMLRMRKPSPRLIEIYLSQIASKENIRLEKEKLHEIAVMSKGDIRQAINMLQLDSISQKDQGMTAQECINQFFSSRNFDDAVSTLAKYPGRPEEKMRDLLISVAKADIPILKKRNMLRCLSDADIIFRAIIRNQDWRLLSYIDKIISKCLLENFDERIVFSRESVPWELQIRIWNESKRLKEAFSVLSTRLKTSLRSFLSQDMPYISFLLEEKSFEEKMRNIINDVIDEIKVFKKI